MSEIVSQSKPGVTRSNTLANIYAGDQQNASFDGERMLDSGYCQLKHFQGVGKSEKHLYRPIILSPSLF